MRTQQLTVITTVIVALGFIGWQLINLSFPYLNTGTCVEVGCHHIPKNGNSVEERTELKCPEKRAIFFLKVHKSGSSTIQNILLRYGKSHHLNFVLPEEKNYVGNPEHFSSGLIGPRLRLPEGEKYDIFTHHTRYDHVAIRNIMQEGSPFVTIMRDPIELQISMYYYYDLQWTYDISLTTLLHQTQSYLRSLPRYYYRIGWNQISWDLGVHTSEFDLPETIPKLIAKVEEEFSLVMITEFMEASLVLFADLMCWPLEEVRYLSLNTHYEEKNLQLTKPVLVHQEKSMLQIINDLDIKLYSHFRKRFKERILKYGVDKMISQVKRLVEMNAKVYNDCIQGTKKPEKEDYKTMSYILKPDAPSLCKEFIQEELEFTDNIRREQEAHINVINKLKTFMIS